MFNREPNHCKCRKQNFAGEKSFQQQVIKCVLPIQKLRLICFKRKIFIPLIQKFANELIDKEFLKINIKRIRATALEAQEKERKLWGQELHDNVNQILVGTKMILSMVKSKPEEAAEMIANVAFILSTGWLNRIEGCGIYRKPGRLYKNTSD